MKLECVEGIVLSETNYSESSKILNVFTKEHGLIGIMSKGCRNMKCKLRGVSRKLLYGKFHIYYKQDGISTLTAVDVVESYSKLLTDLEKVSYAFYLLELTLQVVRENDDSSILELLKDTLGKMEEGFSPMVLTEILELKFLNFLGVSPSIDCCSVCGSDKAIVTIDSKSGGYLCRNCYHNEPIVSDKAIKLIRLFHYVDIKKISKLDVGDATILEINQFLDDYYDRYTGVYLKSKEFIRQLNKLV
ncbi:MAG TPA: DNA repair protein RecO [Candidatus Faecimonas intestinavium]|nr:DNA repair protein RecO [Candidatus Faecimonas intestinavium]